MITIPTTAELYNAIKANLETEFESSIPVFGKNFLRALAGVQAAKLKLYYLAIGKLQKNIFIDTADSESIGGTLERFGRVKLGRNPFPAAVGQYSVTVTGTAGSTIPASSTFKANDDALNPGQLFVLDVAYTLAASTDTITLRALEAGLVSRLMIGDELTATAPIVGVNSLVEVMATVSEPLAPETTEEYRRKALDAYRLEPNGGSASDYRLWGREAQGVREIYPYAKSGAPNEINIYVEATPADSTDGIGTPSGTMLDEVEEVIELDPDTSKPILERGRRPLGVFLIHYLPISVKEIDIVIHDFVGLTPAIQAQILNALTARVNAIRPFVAGADVLEAKNDILDKNLIISTILTVRPGSTFGTIDLLVDSVPVNTWTFINGDIPYLTSVTYV